MPPAALRSPPVANTSGDIPLTVSIDDRPYNSHTTYSWSGGGRVLTLSTVLSQPSVAAELISTYVGHRDTPTIATHLKLGPLGQPPEIHTVHHAHEQLDPIERVRECAYDHAHQLMDVLNAPGHRIAVQLDESSFAQLERVE